MIDITKEAYYMTKETYYMTKETCYMAKENYYMTYQLVAASLGLQSVQPRCC